MQPALGCHTVTPPTLHPARIPCTHTKPPPPCHPLPWPPPQKLRINPAKTDIDSFVFEDFELVDYNPHKAIKMQMAV